jgi:16S rRNA (cytosine1402-N4)-methyltransferase
LRSSEYQHEPVLVDRVVEFLEPARGGVFIDCTVGLGGHASAILVAAASARLIGVDRDPEALAIARERLAGFGDRVRLVEGRFSRLGELMANCGIATASGILADFGVSSMQLEKASRGFSFRRDGVLDMRMGAAGITAAEIVNEWSEADLEEILRKYGEERKARRIARALVAARAGQPLETTGELREVIVGAVGRPRGPEKIDPATRTFQALRIAVNRELAEIEELVEQAARLVDQDGRLVMISYHSLEDRLVKNAFRDLARGEVDEVTGRPRSETQLLELLTRKPVRASEEEIARNRRARSARLRAARRI